MKGSTNVLLFLLIIFFTHLHFDFATSSNISRCREMEWKALMDFKGSLVDEGNRLSSWTGSDCCSWHGITCHNLTGFVQRIDLGNAYMYFPEKWKVLGGHINSSLLQLKHLEHLDLSNNYFAGVPIPMFIGSLTSLKYLRLWQAGFIGEIPQQLGNLSNLQDLSIVGYDFASRSFSSSSRSLNWVTKLSSLRSLELMRINLSESFDWLDSINKLSSLSSLSLTDCELVGMPLSHDLNLTSLVSIGLSYNNFNSALPPSFFNLTSLEDIRIFQSSLRGPIPDMFQKLTALNSLELSSNSFESSLPDSVCTLAALTSLTITDSNLQGSLPSCLGNLTNLIMIVLEDNQLSGRFTSSLGKLSKLEALDVSNNLLTGRVPTFDPNATIEYLALSNNEFTGNIPDELCNFHSLMVLKLSKNRLIGRIPSCLGNLQNLSELCLSNNKLSGYIPIELGYLNRLYILQLNGNKLFGELPSSLQNLTWLKTLDLGKNELQGSIPNWIGKELIQLENLILESNHFSGEISLNLCQLPSLRILYLPDNNLIGTIPNCLGNLSKMLSNDNSDVGSILDTILSITSKGIELEYSSYLDDRRFISLSGNQLHGNIPDELMDLTELQSLNLSNNKLTGNIPKRIGNMKHLESLDLSSNKLSGTIPQSLASINDLGYLNLSFNNLSGRIPSGGHFDTFDNASVYEGNGELCGKPTNKSCEPSKQKGLVSDGNDDTGIELEWLYAGIGPGFAVGFLGVFCLLFFKSSWRYRYFRFLENVYNRF